MCLRAGDRWSCVQLFEPIISETRRAPKQVRDRTVYTSDIFVALLDLRDLNERDVVDHNITMSFLVVELFFVSVSQRTEPKLISFFPHQAEAEESVCQHDPAQLNAWQVQGHQTTIEEAETHQKHRMA